MNTKHIFTPLWFSSRIEFFSEAVDLQLDYWVSTDSTPAVPAFEGFSSLNQSVSGISTDPSSTTLSTSVGSKNTIKTSIRHMHVTRSATEPAAFGMQYWVKEKKPKSKSG